jgi:hypothetical protein
LYAAPGKLQGEESAWPPITGSYGIPTLDITP